MRLFRVLRVLLFPVLALPFIAGWVLAHFGEKE